MLAFPVGWTKSGLCSYDAKARWNRKWDYCANTIRLKWEQNDYICKGRIRNAITVTMFDMYYNKSTAKEVWNALEAKYLWRTQQLRNFWLLKFSIIKWLDARQIVEQFNDIMYILNQFTKYNMNMDESIKVSSIIDKLFPSWKDQRKIHKYNEDISLDNLA